MNTAGKGRGVAKSGAANGGAAKSGAPKDGAAKGGAAKSRGQAGSGAAGAAGAAGARGKGGSGVADAAATSRKDASGAARAGRQSGSTVARPGRSGPGAPAGGFDLAQPLRPPSPGRAAAYLLLFVLGAVVGVAGTLLEAAWFPGGLLLALAGSAGTFLGGARALGGRAGAVAPAAGWLVAVMWLTAARPEGDYVFGAQLSPYLFLLGGMAVAVISATMGGPRHDQGASATLGR